MNREMTTREPQLELKKILLKAGRFVGAGVLALLLSRERDADAKQVEDITKPQTSVITLEIDPVQEALEHLGTQENIVPVDFQRGRIRSDQNVNLRENPTTASQALTQIPPGTEVVIKGKVEVEDSDDWFVVEYGEEVGFVYGGLIEPIVEDQALEDQSLPSDVDEPAIVPAPEPEDEMSQPGTDTPLFDSEPILSEDSCYSPEVQNRIISQFEQQVGEPLEAYLAKKNLSETYGLVWSEGRWQVGIDSVVIGWSEHSLEGYPVAEGVSAGKNDSAVCIHVVNPAFRDENGKLVILPGIVYAQWGLQEGQTAIFSSFKNPTLFITELRQDELLAKLDASIGKNVFVKFVARFKSRQAQESDTLPNYFTSPTVTPLLRSEYLNQATQNPSLLGNEMTPSGGEKINPVDLLRLVIGTGSPGILTEEVVFD